MTIMGRHRHLSFRHVPHTSSIAFLLCLIEKLLVIFKLIIMQHENFPKMIFFNIVKQNYVKMSYETMSEEVDTSVDG